jgi:hypothetical protein
MSKPGPWLTLKETAAALKIPPGDDMEKQVTYLVGRHRIETKETNARHGTKSTLYKRVAVETLARILSMPSHK